MTEMEMTALKATVLLSMGRPRMKASVTMKQTALMGVPGMDVNMQITPVQPPGLIETRLVHVSSREHQEGHLCRG